MKKTLALAIVLAAVITSAQTETTTTAPAATTTEAAPAAPVAKSKVKKAKKKKSNKAGAAIDSVSKPVANVTTKKAGLPATAASAANDAGKTVVAKADVKTSEGTAAAAGTSTVATADVAPAKKWGGFVNVYSTDDATDVQNIQTLTSIGGSYKIADKVTLKAGETFETLTVGQGASDTPEKREMVQKSNFRPAYLDVSIGTKLPGMFGSNEQSASLNYRAMGNDSVYTTQTGYAGIVGMYEGNLTTVFAVTPKFEISVSSQIRHVVPKGDAPESNRILAIPYFNYAINDTFTVYQAGGMILSLRDNMDLRRKYERVYLETGVSINATKNLNISLDVSQDKAIYSAMDDVPVSNFDVYAPNQNAALGKSSAADRTLDAVAYEMYVSYSF